MSSRGLEVVPSSRQDEESITISICYYRACEAFRGLGHVLGVTRASLAVSPTLDRGSRWRAVKRLLSVREQCQFETLGTMVDCSRNGIMRVESVKFLCRKLALMGYNML